MGKVELCEHSRVDSSSKGFPWDCSEGRDEGSRYLLNGRPTRGASSCCMLATFKLSFEHEKWILDGCPTGRKALLAPPYSSELLSAGACVCHKMARNHHPSLLVLAFRLFFMGINLYLTSCFRFTTTTQAS